MASIILKNAKTVWVDEKSFNIPNTEIYIWKVKLEIDGERGVYSTMSKKVATEGFESDLELYTNANGKDYVRPAKAAENAPNEGKTWVDNSDGQRQGMCFNNAAAYVLARSVAKGKDLDPEQWALLVADYAQALYLKSELSKSEEFEENE